MHCVGSENDVDTNIWNRCSRFVDVLVGDRRAVAVYRVLVAIALVTLCFMSVEGAVGMWRRRAPAGQPPCERLRNAAALPEIKPIAEVCVSFTLRRA